MAIIRKFNNLSISAYRPNLTEYNGGLVIGGAVYDPVTLLPNNKFVEFSATGSNLSVTQHSLPRGWSKSRVEFTNGSDNCGYRHNIANQLFPNCSLGSGILESSLEANSTYVSCGYSGAGNYLSKTNSSDSSETIAINTGVGYVTNASVIHEDANRVLFGYKDGTSLGTFNYTMVYVDKATWVRTPAPPYGGATNINNCELVMLSKDANHMVLCWKGSISQGVFASHYTANGTRTDISASLVANVGLFKGVTQARPTTGNNREFYILGATGATLFAQRQTYDTTLPVVRTPVACTFDYTKAANGFVTLPASVVTTDESASFNTWISVIGGTSYILHGLTTHFNSTTTIPSTGHGLYAYEIDFTTNTKLFYRAGNTSWTSRPVAMIPFGANLDNILVVTTTTIETWLFTPSTGFTRQAVFNITANQAGFDSQNRLWVIDTSFNLHLLTPTLTATVVLTWGAQSYSYTGTTINSTLAVSAFNFTGVRIATNVQISVEGPFFSFSDASKIKTVATLATGDVVVNTTITGAGYIKAYANIVP